MSGTPSGDDKKGASAQAILHERQLETLYDALEADNIDFAVKVIGFMADSKNIPAVGPLTALLEYPDDVVRAQSAMALGRIGDKEAIESLVSALSTSTDRVKVSIVIALGMFGDKSVIKPIESILLTPDEPRLINAVRSTVYKLNHPESLEKL
jgi:HEAT repeat protein